MRTLTLDNAVVDLKNLVCQTINDRDETIIVSNEGAVVMLEEKEWSHMKEMLRLLSDKSSLAALIESHAIRDRGEKPESLSIEEVFTDV
jgi:PHD/YefM family antitoxin component YafN of YafNO toxin-antitoxin module